MRRARALRAAGGYDAWQERTRMPLAVLAALFLAVLLVELLWRQRPPAAAAALRAADYGIWAAFAVDYVARLYLAPDRPRFVRRHVPDLLVVVIPTLRPLRLLRIARLAAVLGVLGRRSKSTAPTRIAVSVTLAAVVLLFVAAAAMFDAERDAPGANIHSLGDALWWACTTVTTVGYGDRFPVTTAGRLIAVGLMVVGIALLGVVTAAVAAWFVGQLRAVTETEQQEETTLAEVVAELRALRQENAGIGAQLRALQQRPPD